MLKNRLLASWLLFRSFPKPSLYEFFVHSDDIFEFVSLRFVATIIPERKSYGPNRQSVGNSFLLGCRAAALSLVCNIFFLFSAVKNSDCVVPENIHTAPPPIPPEIPV